SGTSIGRNAADSRQTKAPRSGRLFLLLAGRRQLLPQPLHALLQYLARWPDHLLRQRSQRPLGHIQHVEEVRRGGVHIEHSGEHLAFLVCNRQPLQCIGLVGGIVFFLQLAQAQTRPIVHGDVNTLARLVFHADVLERRDEAHVLQRLLVVFGVFVRLGRALVIV